ncbi:hypothetical protein GF336_06155 [Candidatus Woesearchaeota archaeon]|nr:hypothetical protein [Candidatus Woesearchaeota archaeon]
MFDDSKIKMKNPVLISCEHGSRKIPLRYWNLGLKRKDIRKVSYLYDVGSREVAYILSKRLGAELIVPMYSRLLVDMNRSPGDPTIFRSDSFGRKIPGNMDIPEMEKKKRISKYYNPYHRKLLKKTISLRKKHELSYYVIVHSFNHIIGGVERTPDVGVLWKFRKDRKFCKAIKRKLTDAGLDARFNKPYTARGKGAYCMTVYGNHENMRCVEFEINDKFLKSRRGIKKMGKLLSAILKDAIR